MKIIQIPIDTEIYARLCTAYFKWAGKYPEDDEHLTFLLRAMLTQWERMEKERN